ncbi:hypothetical protein [Pseudanabaena mucicola]|uniref:Uncharacterized protein n=1 Tax=Pseudanabaena mucicola FACHB-723 TaxID=2692860 RepID=A0ABR7ZSS1_9CYAN|nr:hypothetical protein [Pseudanabaena mucicola]MBD2186782.1 hypothetical protein [Pseudanabaena mucicola FACHB-723]
MQTLTKNIKQQKGNNYDDCLTFKEVDFKEVDAHPIFEDVIENYEPKDYLHPNYRHWAWLPKPN